MYCWWLTGRKAGTSPGTSDSRLDVEALFLVTLVLLSVIVEAFVANPYRKSLWNLVQIMGVKRTGLVLLGTSGYITFVVFSTLVPNFYLGLIQSRETFLYSVHGISKSYVSNILVVDTVFFGGLLCFGALGLCIASIRGKKLAFALVVALAFLIVAGYGLQLYSVLMQGNRQNPPPQILMGFLSLESYLGKFDHTFQYVGNGLAVALAAFLVTGFSRKIGVIPG